MIGLGFCVIKLRSRRIHSNHYLLARFVTGYFNRLQNHFNGFYIGFKVGCKSTFIAYIGWMTCFFQYIFEVMKNFRTPAKRFWKGLSPNRHDHKLLKIDGIVGMTSSIQNVHHGHRKRECIYTTYITVKRHARFLGCGFGNCQRNTKNGIGAQLGLVFCTIKFNHVIVDAFLIGNIPTFKCIRQNCIHMFNRLKNGLAHVKRLIAISEFHRLVCAGWSTGRHSSAAHESVFSIHINLDGRVATGVENLTTHNLFNIAHTLVLVYAAKIGHSA